MKHVLGVRLEAARNNSGAPLTSSSRSSFTSAQTPHWLRIQARVGEKNAEIFPFREHRVVFESDMQCLFLGERRKTNNIA